LKIINLKDLQPGFFQHPVVTVGIFDGVHRGHKNLIGKLKEISKEKNGESVIITLWPHPRMILYPDKQIKLLTTLEEKLFLLEKEDITSIVILDFDKNVASVSAQEFIEKFLVKKLNISAFLVGYDNHFGHDKEGKIDIVRQESEKWGYEAIQVDPVFVNEEPISSTNIRLYLELGNIEKANELLGYNFFLNGKVIEGNKLGRTINFPTANIAVADYKMLPRTGVYAVTVESEGNTYPGMMNIGFRPTINSLIKEKSLEVHLINFQGNLYDREIKVNFVNRIRDEIKFPNLNELKKQLEIDKQKIIRLLLDTYKF
jgi:riboflavin kinase/FMN adenylyltransferase